MDKDCRQVPVEMPSVVSGAWCADTVAVALPDGAGTHACLRMLSSMRIDFRQ